MACKVSELKCSITSADGKQVLLRSAADFPALSAAFVKMMNRNGCFVLVEAARRFHKEIQKDSSSFPSAGCEMRIHPHFTVLQTQTAIQPSVNPYSALTMEDSDQDPSTDHTPSGQLIDIMMISPIIGLAIWVPSSFYL